ncbi:hypothetical protein AQUCO_00400137v1 [Aquilegia coerulea]|uniref:Uncharacterized protein n=1 Tax=Aquilegia coerulea TaxID=218851 RepID=A0A2G5ETH8_AQUCA|nr:hypothetical protein AQUCO_00400137v1 [Aquilegia coerulea]
MSPLTGTRHSDQMSMFSQVSSPNQIFIQPLFQAHLINPSDIHQLLEASVLSPKTMLNVHLLQVITVHPL